MSENSIEKRLGSHYRLSRSDREFITAMRRFADRGVGFGFMQQVIEWEWQDRDSVGAWGPEWLGSEIKRLSAEVADLKDILRSVYGYVPWEYKQKIADMGIVEFPYDSASSRQEGGNG